MQDVTMHMLIQILTPFVIYLAAEEIGVSGILAVVVRHRACGGAGPS